MSEPSTTPVQRSPVDSYDYGTLKTASPFYRFLWWCAGADAQLLVRCPAGDRVKYQGIGGIVLATGLLAFLSGSYAFITVFGPKDATAFEATIDAQTIYISLACGAFWGLMIFNIERFIVSSTGKGDGTDTITLRELWNGMPRIAMAVLTGLCLSAPLEIRLLKTEIDSALAEEQKELQATLDAKSEELIAEDRTRYEAERAEVQARIDASMQALDERRKEINAKRTALEEEIAGRVGSGKSGDGPAAAQQRRTIEAMQAELEADTEAKNRENQELKARVDEYTEKLKSLDDKLAEEKAYNEEQAHHLDGLQIRIKLAHEKGGLIAFFITVLFVVIEIAPILFKMQLTHGTYDLLTKNQEKLAAAHHGIEPEGRTLLLNDSVEPGGVPGLGSDGSGPREHQVPVHHFANSLFKENTRRFETEQLLADRVHAVYRENTLADIHANPDRYTAGGRTVSNSGPRSPRPVPVAPPPQDGAAAPADAANVPPLTDASPSSVADGGPSDGASRTPPLPPEPPSDSGGGAV
jgi:hypothetical protein